MCKCPVMSGKHGFLDVFGDHVLDSFGQVIS